MIQEYIKSYTESPAVKMQTAREEEEALIADEKLLMELSRIVYREKFSDNSNVKNYKIAHHIDFYYMDEDLINATEAENTEPEEHVEEQTSQEFAAEVQSAEVQPVEVQPFCIYDEVCSEKKMCGNCAAYEYERIQYEEAWERRSMGKF